MLIKMPVFKTKNENFFKKFSSEMAYVLGFFAADGNLTLGKRGNHYIEFNSCDRDIIEKIRNVMECNHKISGVKKHDSHKMCYRIQVGSKDIFRDLINLGFVPNKSKRLAYPKVPNQYFPDFVRGYFDGDGHVTVGIYKRKNRPSMQKVLFSGFTSGTKSFLQTLKNDLTKLEIIKGGTLYYQKGYRLTFSIYDSLSLYAFLYKNINNGLYLARKKKVFERYSNGPVEQPGVFVPLSRGRSRVQIPSGPH